MFFKDVLYPVRRVNKANIIKQTERKDFANKRISISEQEQIASQQVYTGKHACGFSIRVSIYIIVL